MNSSAYWNSKIDYYYANRPPKAESYYNQSFVDEMNKAKANIDNLVAEKDKSWAAYGQSRDDYDLFKGTISRYDEVYNQSKSQFGVEEHKSNYEKSKEALAMAESTLAALPSSINASSNKVLTQSQREARYNTLADRAMFGRDNLMAQTSAYEDVWKKARESQSAYVTGEMATQYSKLGHYNNAYVDAINDFNNAQKRLTEGRVELQEWQSKYREWQFNQWAYNDQVWLNNLLSATDRYIQALNTEMTIRNANLERSIADLRRGMSSVTGSMANALIAYNNYKTR